MSRTQVTPLSLTSATGALALAAAPDTERGPVPERGHVSSPRCEDTVQANAEPQDHDDAVVNLPVQRIQLHVSACVAFLCFLFLVPSTALLSFALVFCFDRGKVMLISEAVLADRGYQFFIGTITSLSSLLFFVFSVVFHRLHGYALALDKKQVTFELKCSLVLFSIDRELKISQTLLLMFLVGLVGNICLLLVGILRVDKFYFPHIVCAMLFFGCCSLWLSVVLSTVKKGLAAQLIPNHCPRIFTLLSILNTFNFISSALLLPIQFVTMAFECHDLMEADKRCFSEPFVTVYPVAEWMSTILLIAILTSIVYVVLTIPPCHQPNVPAIELEQVAVAPVQPPVLRHPAIAIGSAPVSEPIGMMQMDAFGLSL